MRQKGGLSIERRRADYYEEGEAKMYRLLIADDERDERKLVRFLLADFHEELEILEAANGREALRLVGEKRVDILISDIQMPFLNGIELAGKARKLQPRMEILFFSGYDDFAYVQNALSLRAVNYILKPINPQTFRKSFLELLERLCADPADAAPSCPAMDPLQSCPEVEATLFREIELAIALKRGDQLREKANALLACYAKLEDGSSVYVRYSCTKLAQQLMAQIPDLTQREFASVAEKIYRFPDFSEVSDLVGAYLEKAISNLEQEFNASDYAVHQVKQYIETHYSEDLSLGRMADMVFLSPNYLSNAFTRFSGCSLNKYIKQVRLRKARELLDGTTMKVADIGRAVGYPNASYFIKKFQEMYGDAPERYRLNVVEEGRPRRSDRRTEA
jgi:two-component system response regulator YesN